MASATLTFNPSCRPDTWILLVGTDRFASAAIDPFNRFLLQAEWADLDPYAPDFFLTRARALFTDRAEIRKIHVCFLLPQWFWTPTSLEADVFAPEGPAANWPQRSGHSWIADQTGPANATAWVNVPQQILTQLNQLSAPVGFKHASVFCSPARAGQAYRLEILRVGNLCWFSLWAGERFLYGQPHTVTTPEDLLYVLALLSEKFSFRSDRLPIFLTGDWSLEENWLVPLRQRFARLETRDAAWKNLPGDQPAHAFTPLEDIFSCA